MRTLRAVSILSLFILAGCGPGRPDLRTLQLNREGNKSFSEQKYPTAMDKYIQALTYDPFVSSLHLNLGLSLEGQEQAEQALRAYKEAESLAVKEKNIPLIFGARFNQAQLLAKGKKIDEALALYQKALEILPTSIETKTNIELLTQGQSGQGGDENKDQQDQKEGGEGQDQKEPKDPKDQKDQKDQDSDKDEKDKQDKPKQVQQSAKYKPRPFEGKELSESDVKKILGELKQQEEKIRAEYNRQDTKEQPRAKDW